MKNLDSVAAAHWRQGFATETARPLGFAQLQSSTIIAFTRPDNTASRQVVAQVEMSCQGAFLHHGKPPVL